MKKNPNEFHNTINITELKSEVNFCSFDIEDCFLILKLNDIDIIEYVKHRKKDFRFSTISLYSKMLI
jgi:hypothetical protein